MHLFRGLLVVLALAGVLGAAAQDEVDSPLLRVLASVPDTAEVRATFSYADYAAIAGAGVNEEEFLRGLGEVQTGPPLEYAHSRLEEQEALMGVPFLAIAQGAYWGRLPQHVMLYQGAFDLEAVRAAYAARGFSETDLNGLPLFCAPAGCDSGSMISMDARNPVDPFGGALGRQQPVLFVPVGDTAQLLSSPVLTVVQASAGALTGETPPLGASPDVQAAIRAAQGEAGLLRQVTLLSAESIGPAPASAKPLPAYQFGLLGEAETDGEVSASVTLVYGTLAEAEAAAAALGTRLEAYESMRVRAMFTDMLAERGVEVAFSAAEDADTGLAVAQVVFTGPDDARTFGLLMEGFYMRDLGWLAVEAE